MLGCTLSLSVLLLAAWEALCSEKSRPAPTFDFTSSFGPLGEVVGRNVSVVVDPLRIILIDNTTASKIDKKMLLQPDCYLTIHRESCQNPSIRRSLFHY